VLWLNATPKIALEAGFRLAAQGLITAEELVKLSDEHVVVRTHGWLCDVRHTKWLLLLDNYDEPAQFDIGRYVLMLSRICHHYTPP